MIASEEPRREILLELLRAALAAVDGRRRTHESLRQSGATPGDAGPVWVAAIGKAASSMVLGAHDALGARIERVLLITKDGHVDPGARTRAAWEIHESSHPVPDQRSLEAGARLLEFVAQLPRAARPLFLISGGASSLVEALVPGVGLEALRRLNEEGLAGGLSIEALNERRRRISRIKGGRLSALVSGRRALALFISDVPRDDPAVIGSGLLGPAPADECRTVDDVERVVVAGLSDALEAIRVRAKDLAVTVERKPYEGSVERLAVRFAHETALGPGGVRAWGGESTVELPEAPGRGGRNQHLALAAARLIAGRQDLFVLAAGTDGTDGPTDDAGALVDGETCARVSAAGLDVDDCLRRADSGTALAASGDLIHTGPTGTNVGDLVIGVRISRPTAREWLRAQRGGDTTDGAVP